MPIAQVKKVVFSVAGIKDFMDQLKAGVAAVGPLNLATVHLYINNIDPTPNTLFADLGEVVVGDWAEYAAIATTGWGAKETRVDGSVQVVATPLLAWTGPAAGGGPTVRGAAIKSPLAGTHHLATMPFVTPIPMTDATQVLDLLLPFILGGGPFVA